MTILRLSRHDKNQPLYHYTHYGYLQTEFCFQPRNFEVASLATDQEYGRKADSANDIWQTAAISETATTVRKFYRTTPKVSGTPGKTRLVNHFRINDAWYLVDLPGYGYARTSKTQRSEFSKLITDYVIKCEKMHFLFVLADIRLEPQKIDLRFIEMLGENGIPFGIIFTKADKLSKTQREKSVERFRTALAQQWEELPPMFVSSSEKAVGREEILDFIGECLRQN